MNGDWNPRFVAYAASLGRTPEEQQALTTGRNHGFMAWVTEQWATFDAEHPYVVRTDEVHEQFDAWLDGRIPSAVAS